MEVIVNKGPLTGQGLTAEIHAWGDGQVLKLFHIDSSVASSAGGDRSFRKVIIPACADPISPRLPA